MHKKVVFQAIERRPHDIDVDLKGRKAASCTPVLSPCPVSENYNPTPCLASLLLKPRLFQLIKFRASAFSFEFDSSRSQNKYNNDLVQEKSVEFRWEMLTMQRSSTPHSKEQDYSHDRREEPKQHIDQVDPHRALHSLDPRLALRILMDVELPEDAKYGCP